MEGGPAIHPPQSTAIDDLVLRWSLADVSNDGLLEARVSRSHFVDDVNENKLLMNNLESLLQPKVESAGHVSASQ